MDWLFENLGKLAPLVIFLLYMISSLKGRGEPEEEEVDPQAAERARKIQEEIRRKIEERQRGASSESKPAEAPKAEAKPAPSDSFYGRSEGSFSGDGQREEWERRDKERRQRLREQREEVETRVPDGEWEPFRPIPPQAREVIEEEPALAFEEDPYEEQRRQIAEKLKKAEELKEKALQTRSKVTKPQRAERVSLPASRLREEVLADLSGPASLRKAVLLKEVLDKPVGLR